jgi:hypothetical protein
VASLIFPPQSWDCAGKGKRLLFVNKKKQKSFYFGHVSLQRHRPRVTKVFALLIRPASESDSLMIEADFCEAAPNTAPLH